MYVSSATQSIALHVEDPFYLRGLLPQSRTLHDPEYNFAAKWTLHNTRVLRNLGYEVPSPIRCGYLWPGRFQPYEHQIEMAEFWTLNKRGFNLSDPGTMKTNSALWAADYLMKLGEIKKVLICAPLSTLETVWLQDIFDTLMHRRAVVVHGSRDQRKKALSGSFDFYILNHDGVKIAEINKIIRSDKDISVVIIDEGDEFRNAQSEKYKALAAMLRPDMRLWWQTGTPCPNDPTDAWAQAKLVNPTGVPKYFGQFKRDTMMQITPFKWVPRRGANSLAYEVMQPAIRFRKQDCITLPPVVTTRRQAQLTAAQRKAFDTMKEEMYLEDVKNQLNGGMITAVNAADRITKLRQILCGCVKDPDSDTYMTIDHAPRVQVLMDCIARANAKVIVIVPFKGIIKSLAKEIAKQYSVGVLNGDVSPGQRRKTIQDFKSGADPHVLLCHPKVMSHGLNLTEADTTIFYAPIFSNAQFQQVIERFNRAGQKNHMTLVRIGAHPLEWDYYDKTDVATKNQYDMLQLYRKYIA